LEADLISKKDLLASTGISYGQLYRWKRKGLIPEDWFVRKSAFTGQETFFPREKMLARVEKILTMKDEDTSLDDIADAVSASPLPDTFARADLETRGIAGAVALGLFDERHKDVTELRFEEVVAVSVADTLLRGGEAGTDEARAAMAAFEEGWGATEGTACDLVLLRKMGVAIALLVSSSSELIVDSGTRLVTRTDIAQAIEELKERLR
jgi:DNA-binding transcriptional MerR regulator